MSLNSFDNDDTVSYFVSDISKPINIDQKFDYVIHMASNTHPEQYKRDPVGTITTNIFGTYNLLTLSVSKNIDKFILASSCEIYGEGVDTPIDESYSGYIDCNTLRAGYNESKRLSECLCNSFSHQYGVNYCTFRLARVIGPDRTKVDSKAMSQFMRNAVDGEDIILNSFGTQKYSYIYISDAVLGILKILIDGKNGEAYNLAANNDGSTLKDYAEYLASLANTKVVYDGKTDIGASKSQNSLLDNTKKMGFEPLYSVFDGLKRTFMAYKMK